MKDDVTKAKEFYARVKESMKKLVPAGYPDELRIDDHDPAFEGMAVDGLIQLTKHALELKDSITDFAIAHELGHIATLPLLRARGLPVPPKGLSFFAGEHIADLIAIHVLLKHFADVVADLDGEEQPFSLLTDVLGGEDATHPSGTARVSLMREYCKRVSRGEDADKVLRDLLKEKAV